jgi:hypothetical protein
MQPRNVPTYPADVKSQPVTNTVDKPAEMREAKKLKSLATAVIRRVRLLSERQREARELTHQKFQNYKEIS